MAIAFVSVAIAWKNYSTNLEESYAKVVELRSDILPHNLVVFTL
ncbi:MAG: hypothetical protein AB4426_09400 [Xenococcaceae cyanobacterium]